MIPSSLYMRRCLELAQLGMYQVAPNPMVGAVLVDAEGTILAEGWHRQFGGPHAEVECFRAFDNRGMDNVDLCQATIYVSLEPCAHYGKTPPCAKLLIERGVGHVVIGCLDPNPKVSGKGVEILREAGIDVQIGVLEDECRQLNKRFLCLQEKHRPYVILKWAQTADGYVDVLRDIHKPLTINHKPLVISTPYTKQIVHQLRAENMAIMVGTNTVLLDNPGLRTTRWSGKDPIRVTLDRHHRIPADAKILAGPHDSAYWQDREHVIPSVIVYREDTSWTYILRDLASRGIHSILVEGGPTLHRHILESGLYDELHIETSQHTLAELTGDPEAQGVPAAKV